MQLESYLSEEVRSLLFSLLKRVLSLVSLERLILYKRAMERPFLVWFCGVLFKKNSVPLLPIITNAFDICWSYIYWPKPKLLFKFRSHTLYKVQALEHTLYIHLFNQCLLVFPHLDDFLFNVIIKTSIL